MPFDEIGVGILGHESPWLRVSTLCVLATHVGHSICHGHHTACVLVKAFLINTNASQLYNGHHWDTSSHTFWLPRHGCDLSSLVSLFLRVLFFSSRGPLVLPWYMYFLIYIFFSLSLDGKVAIYPSGSHLFHLTQRWPVPSIFLETKQFSSLCLVPKLKNRAAKEAPRHEMWKDRWTWYSVATDRVKGTKGGHGVTAPSTMTLGMVPLWWARGAVPTDSVPMVKHGWLPFSCYLQVGLLCFPVVS